MHPNLRALHQHSDEFRMELAHPKAAVPTAEVDLFSDEVILDPYPHYADLRELGPVVWLPKNQVYAVSRYAEVTEALRNTTVFISSKGLSLSQKVNDLLVGSTLNSDPPEHDRTRAVTGAPLLPGALGEVQGTIESACETLTEALIRKGTFDAIADLAQYLPLTIVAELVGLPSAGKERMLKWASATFNLFGPENERSQRAFDDLKDLRAFLGEYGRPEKLKPDGWAARIFRVGPEQGIPLEQCAQLMRDYINPSLDTTISATGQAISLFAENPEQWQRVRDNPDLIPNAIEEVVRLATPIRAFSRYVREDTVLGGVAIPEGARVLLIYASANRDERKFPNPDCFDVGRKVTDHVGFGHGIHMCMGMHLARLEMISLFRAFAKRIESFELAGEREVALNNTIRAWSKLPVRIQVAETPSVTPPLVSSPAHTERWLTVLVGARRQEAEDIVSLELRTLDGTSLPVFEAGAHVNLRIKSGLIRQYSLSNDPQERDRYRLAILKEAHSRGGSLAVHETLATGSKVQISLPRNNFPLDEQAEHSLLLAGGIGITPLLAMAYRLRTLGKAFTLHYCTRSLGRTAFVDELKVFGERVQIHHDDGPEHQRLQIDRVLGEVSEATHLYTCGPAGFMQFVTEAAKRNHWPKDCVHLEHFGAEIDSEGESFKVTARRSGVTVDVPSGKTIAEALIAHGVGVEMSCQSGVCGTCLTPVLSGTPDHRDLVQTELEKAGNTHITVCCSRSKSSELILDL